MTIASEIRRVSANVEAATHDQQFVLAGKALLAARGNRHEAAALVEAWRAGPRALELVRKAPVDPMVLADSALADYRTMAAAFVASLRNFGAFDAILGAAAFVNVPTMTRIVMVTTGGTGDTPAEASQKILTSLDLSGDNVLAPLKTTVIYATTMELAKLATPAAANFIGNELKTACALATDERFLSIATAAGIASQATAGPTLANIVTDLGYLTDNVATSARSKLFFITTPALAKKLAFKGDTVGAKAFPDLGFAGGSIAGVPVIVSDAVATGDVLLVDGSGFAANSDTIALDGTNQADLQLSTTPDSPPSAGSVLVSLWQKNNVALKATRWWACRRLRDTAAARITGAGY